MGKWGPRWVLPFVVFAVSLFILHCGERKQKEAGQPPPGGAQPAGGGLPAGGQGLLPPIFPHQENWASPLEHGEWVAKGGKEPCMRCHQLEVVEGEGAPTCYSCHALYPHANDWVRQEKHGTVFREGGRQNCATQCHGIDLKGGLSKVSCDLCHAIYPHPPLWVAPAEHGNTAKRDGKLLCKGCHGEDLRGGNSGVSCYQCHANFPHEPNWQAPERHGAFVQEEGIRSCATQCHGLDLKGGLSEVSCDSCHSFYPHPDGWREFEGHGRFVLVDLGNDTARCKNCHGEDLRGGRTGVSCFACHQQYPHNADWPLPANHGPQSYGNLKNSCATANCHGADLNGTPQAPSCLACHTDFPHTSPQWMTAEPETRVAQGRDEDFHGDRFIGKIRRGELVSCSGCHGAAWDRNLGGVTCIGCHANGITHLPREENGIAIPWEAGLGHGRFFTLSGFNSLPPETSCKKCHGAPADFASGQNVEFLRDQSECYRCHSSYPHKSWDQVSPWRNGHIFYLLAVNNPFFVDADGNHPENPNDPANIPAIQHSCAGSTELSCHFLGARTLPRPQGNGLCGGYCHAPAPQRINAPPQVSSRNPEDRAVNVSVNSSIEVQFSEAMQSNTVIPAFRVSRVLGGAPVEGEVSCSQDWCRTATFRPRNWLTRDALYRAEVDVTATDLDGVALVANGNGWTFRTDNSPAQISSTVPNNGSVNVLVSTTQLTVRFNEQIRCNSVRNDSIALYSVAQNGNLVPVAGRTRCANPGNVYDTVIKFNVTVPRRGTALAYGTNYVARVFGGIQDLGGNTNPVGVQFFQWSFTTEFAEEEE